jgi:hypothetical protein
MATFNVLRFRVKPGHDTAFLDAHLRRQAQAADASAALIDIRQKPTGQASGAARSPKPVITPIV